MDAKVISSHTLLNVKTEDNVELSLKSRNVVHGNLDAEKNDVRDDCAVADMLMVRSML